MVMNLDISYSQNTSCSIQLTHTLVGNAISSANLFFWLWRGAFWQAGASRRVIFVQGTNFPWKLTYPRRTKNCKKGILLWASGKNTPYQHTTSSFSFSLISVHPFQMPLTLSHITMFCKQCKTNRNLKLKNVIQKLSLEVFLYQANRDIWVLPNIRQAKKLILRIKKLFILKTKIPRCESHEFTILPYLKVSRYIFDRLFSNLHLIGLIWKLPLLSALDWSLIWEKQAD